MHKRPINVGIPDLLVFRFPITAISSISHRIAGVALFLGLSVMLFALQKSLQSEESFNLIREALGSPLGLFIFVGLMAPLVFHFVAGLKHLIMDLGFGETFEGGVLAAKLVFAISALIICFIMIWLLP
ncbi:MAG: succinate dehydrogenase, cytochrome b556 subunit [OM182 bacterium]|uniref:Succinate dehydrogenase cytochrome b556 subunit n=1 Tax=OM182 bacterium TaxID=2510334 RepID=A0A520S0U0_9GAMM|nr:MAG: succinate dehydrogenase, cytochrome b556 subunit [OM182 bacterium]